MYVINVLQAQVVLAVTALASSAWSGSCRSSFGRCVCWVSVCGRTSTRCGRRFCPTPRRRHSTSGSSKATRKTSSYATLTSRASSVTSRPESGRCRDRRAGVSLRGVAAGQARSYGGRFRCLVFLEVVHCIRIPMLCIIRII